MFFDLYVLKSGACRRFFFVCLFVGCLVPVFLVYFGPFCSRQWQLIPANAAVQTFREEQTKVNTQHVKTPRQHTNARFRLLMRKLSGTRCQSHQVDVGVGRVVKAVTFAPTTGSALSARPLVIGRRAHHHTRHNIITLPAQSAGGRGGSDRRGARGGGEGVD